MVGAIGQHEEVMQLMYLVFVDVVADVDVVIVFVGERFSANC